MNHNEKEFLKESEMKVTDLVHRKKINHVLKQSDEAFEKGKKQFYDLNALRERAKNIKWKALESLDHYLLEFETKFTNNGGRVIWADSADRALEAVWDICQRHNAKTIVKSKSMVTEEIQLNHFLTDHKMEIIETDLGEYIQQLDGERPYHIVAPAMHKSREEVAELFHNKLGVPANLSPEELTLIARNELREKYREAQIGITGANFILSDIGGIAITENEGNARLTSSFPKVHIVITGIEKVLPSASDLSLFWPMLATHASGQKITVYNSIICGPRGAEEEDGPEEMYVILLNNGRVRILAEEQMRESLYCIRCGACLNVCPVYRNIGGHSYGATYSGPIGAVITPHLSSMKDYKHLSYASSLCGACSEVCPVHINLHRMLLRNRCKSVKDGHNSRTEALGWYIWQKAMLSRKAINVANGKVKNLVVRNLFSSSWGHDRELPSFPNKSFSQQWVESIKS